MPPPSPADSSTRSKPAPKGSRASAAQQAAEAFAPPPAPPDLRPASSLAPDLSAQRRLSGAYFIRIDRIEPDPNQPRKRIDPAHLEELSASIARLGVLQPISVRLIDETQTYRIIAGECRYTAAKKAGLTELPCWVKSPRAEDVLLEQIVENWQRSDLNPFELADSLAILRDANGFTQQTLAEHTGKSQGEISRLLSLLDLEPDVQSVAREDTTGRITRRHLFSLARLPAVQQTAVLKRVQEDDLPAIDTERLVARLIEKRDQPRRSEPVVRHRKFDTQYATVVFTYRKPQITDMDLLMALKEVKQQILERSGNPADFM